MTMRTIYIPAGEALPDLDDRTVLVGGYRDEYAAAGWAVIVKMGNDDTHSQLRREIKRVQRELSMTTHTTSVAGDHSEAGRNLQSPAN